MRILDLFCGGGGAAVGMARHGHEVTGVDIDPRCGKYYPFTFINDDVMSLPIEFLQLYDFIWASPPCQRYSTATPAAKRAIHPDLVEPVRGMLQAAGVPYCIENVTAAPLQRSVVLCGSMFGLGVVRHRTFEVSGFSVPRPYHPNHPDEVVTVAGSSTKKQVWSEAMGIDWMPAYMIREAVPPAFSEYLLSQIHNDPGAEEERQCRICEEIKPVSEFVTDKRKQGGRAYACRPCHAQYNRRKRRPIAYVS